MNKYIAILLLAFSSSAFALGNRLYLVRWEDSAKTIPKYETYRAEFKYAKDCELVAQTMNKAEPLVTWYCK